MEKNTDIDIRAVTLVSSCGCNLHCQYCMIENSLNGCSAKLQQDTIKALIDGSYLENVKKIFKRLDLDRYIIDNFGFWGQEPTLTLHLITEHLDDWFKFFPNIRNIDFSTNGMDFPERIIAFAKRVDELTTQDDVNLSIQFSYDGAYSTNNIRNANNERIFQTISTVIEGLNKIKFNHTNISIQLHGVLSGTLINQLDTLEKVHDYYKELDTFGYELNEKVINQAITLNPSVSICPEHPRDGSVDERIEYESFLQRLINIDVSDFHDPRMPVSLIVGYRNVYEDSLCDLGEYVTQKGCPLTIEEVLQCIKDKNEEVIRSLSMNNFCGSNWSELKLLWDGTMVSCQNYMFDINPNNIKDDGTIDTLSRKDLMTRGHSCVNLLTASDEEIDKVFYKYNLFKTTSFPFMFQTILNEYQMLNECGQLNSVYKYDYNKLLHLAFITTKNLACTYNNLVSTGSELLRSIGTLRISSALYNYVDRENNWVLPKEYWDDDRYTEQGVYN